MSNCEHKNKEQCNKSTNCTWTEDHEGISGCVPNDVATTRLCVFKFLL